MSSSAHTSIQNIMFLSAPNIYNDLYSIWVKCAGVWANLPQLNGLCQKLACNSQIVYLCIWVVWGKITSNEMVPLDKTLPNVKNAYVREHLM